MKTTVILAIIAYCAVALSGIGIAYNEDIEAEKVLANLEKYSQYCEINNMGKLKSFNIDSFTCSGYKITIPSNLALGRD